MSIVIRVKDADYSANPAKFIPPVVGNLEYWNFFGKDKDTCARNLVIGKADAAVSGTITYDDYSFTSSNGSGVVTPCYEQDTNTLIVVHEAIEADAIDIGNYKSLDSYTSSKWAVGLNVTRRDFSAGNNKVALIGQVGQFLQSNMTSSDNISFGYNDYPASGFMMRAVTTSEPDGAISLYIPTASYAQTATRESTKVRGKSNKSFKVGGGWADGEFTGRSRILAAGIYSRSLSSTEITTLYNFLKTFYAKKNITI